MENEEEEGEDPRNSFSMQRGNGFSGLGGLGLEEGGGLDAKNAHANINYVNIDNLFVGEYETKLSYSDYLSITQDYATMRIDEDVLQVVESYGYPRAFIKDSLVRGDINHATACYYLLLMP